MLNAIDESVDPCDDFFMYACGSWNRKNVIPDDQSSFNTFSKLRDDVNVALKSLLNAKPTRVSERSLSAMKFVFFLLALLEEESSKDEPEAITTIKQIYHLCLDTGDKTCT